MADVNISPKEKICVFSWNSRGFGQEKQIFAKTLVSVIAGQKMPILCNQENFLLKGNMYKVLQALPGFQVILKPAVKNSHDSGRPKNGMFVAIPLRIQGQICDISPEFYRVQAIKIKFKTSSCLLINSYLPCDSRTRQEDPELLQTLQTIRTLVTQSECRSVLWAGDVNADFLRHTNHTERVSEVVEELRLLAAWDRFQVDFTCVHEVAGQSHVSKIDHFFWSESLDNNVEDAGVIHHEDNTSDHNPIYCVLNSLEIEEETTEAKKAKPKPNWKKASPEEKVEYSEKVQNMLNNIEIPLSVLQCKDLHCRDPDHLADLDLLAATVLGGVQGVAEETLPVPGGGGVKGDQEKRVPGWKEEVAPFRDKAYFWSQIWKSCGRPLNSEVHKIMKRSRNIYHFQLKKTRRAEEKIKKNKMLNACLNGEGDIFEEIKAARKTSKVVASSIDGEKNNIANHFSNIYSKLYNSANDDDEMNDIIKKVEELTTQDKVRDIEAVTPEVIKQAAQKLKPGKSDPLFTFSSDCIKHGPDRLYSVLSSMYQGFMFHAYVPKGLLISTLIPIVKDPLSSINLSKNYRSVSLSSLLIKLLDWIIILLSNDTLGLDELQFAYQKDCSTTMCTWAALETIDYFLRNGNNVYTVATDMSKAFDLALHSKMFHKMIFEKNVSVVYVRIMIVVFRNQVSNVRWVQETGENFPVRNGTGQGRVFAAIAYCLYMEGLFKELRRRRSGCWIQGEFRGIYGYSDDNWALAPSLSALQDMITTMELYAEEHNLKFSTDPVPRRCKTKTMAFIVKKTSLRTMMLCGNPLPWVSKLKHLGMIVTNQVNGCQEDMRVKNARYIDKNNQLNQEFYFAHTDTKMKLNSIYNSHFTGSQCWDIFSEGAMKLEGSWNRSIKIVHNLPWPTHRSLMTHISGTAHMKTLLMTRMIRFVEKLKMSKKLVLRQLLRLTMNNTRSVTGRNLRGIMLLTTKNKVGDLTEEDAKMIQYHPLCETELWRVSIVKEILEIKCGEVELPEGWTWKELENVLEDACTT